MDMVVTSMDMMDMMGMMGMMDNLREEGFEAFGRPKLGTGVYLLLLAGVVIYVGKSLNIYHRIGQHVLAMRRHRKGLRQYRSH